MAILAHKSFDKAAKQLCITQSAVSQRLKQFEDRLGSALIIRTPEITPTDAGYAVIKYARQRELLDASLEQSLQLEKQQTWTKMALGVNADTLATWLLDVLAPWCQQHHVLLSLAVDDQDETHHLLNQGRVHACISAKAAPSQGHHCYPLGEVKYHCVVSPEFYRRHFPDGVTREALQQAPMVRFNKKDFLQHYYLERYFQLDAEQHLHHTVPSSEGYLQWILLGMGFGMIPTLQMQPYLATKALIALTPDHTIDVPLYWHDWGIDNMLLKSLRNKLIQDALQYHF